MLDSDSRRFLADFRSISGGFPPFFLPGGDASRAAAVSAAAATAEEVAAAICFLASPAASFITGVALPVDGGVTSGTGQWATYGGRKAGFA